MTTKQKQEIDFFSKGFIPTEQEIADYIDHTVNGGKNLTGKFSDNRLMIAKTSWDRNLKMWREDIIDGLLSYGELIDDFDSEWAKKSIKSLMKGIMNNNDIGRQHLRRIFNKDDSAGVVLLSRKQFCERP